MLGWQISGEPHGGPACNRHGSKYRVGTVAWFAVVFFEDNVYRWHVDGSNNPKGAYGQIVYCPFTIDGKSL